MKLGFSTIGCPTWDLPKVVSQATTLGFAGVEIRGLMGELNLPLCPALSADLAATRALFAESGVELVCLSSSAAFHYRDAFQVEDNKAQVREFIELAGRLGCPFVRVFGAEIPRARLFGYERREAVLERIASALRDLAPYAAEHQVTLLIENSGDFVDSLAMWYLVDAACSPAVKCCWAPFAAMTRNELPTTSIPRLGRKIAMVHLCDGKFDASGGVEAILPPGQGDLDLPRLVELLRGIAFDGYLMLDWPKLWNPSLADAERVFPQYRATLTELLNQKPVVLTAYKGDKNAPKFARPATTATTPT
ncbi:MAG: sugar phosphate isomerase/epimerase [Phycisphaerae bacterium]|nr:sugar phosphate isomerase/epimerase [Phycisphaerae bacterium]